VYELLNYVINEQLNVNPVTILEPGQGERQARTLRQHYPCKKVHFIQQEARRQGKRVYRVDIDFKKALNTISHTALWQVMRMFEILIGADI